MFKLKFFLIIWILEHTCLAQAKGPERRQLHFEIAVKPDSELGRPLVEAMTKVLDQLGYDLHYTEYPAKRGLLEFKEGRIDGTIGRIGDLSKFLQSQQLKRVDAPVAVFNYSRWCRKETRADLSRIRVGSRLGALAMMMLEPQLSSPPVEVLEMQNQSSGVKMLKSARLDCILTTEMTLESEKVTAQDLQEFDRADLVTFQVFPWILDKHEPIRKALADGLRNYPFSPEFKRKYQSSKKVCEGQFNSLCPDGILFRKKVQFTVGS